jgi:glutaredoxin
MRDLRRWFRPLVRWLGWRRRPDCSHLHFTLYTRHDCPLCDEARELLHREQQRHGFQLTVIDVDTDARLREQHGNWVPVVCVDGQIRFRGKINPVLLARLLRVQ